MAPPQPITIGGKPPAAFFAARDPNFPFEKRVQIMTRQPAFERLSSNREGLPPVEEFYYRQMTLEELGFNPSRRVNCLEVQHRLFTEFGGRELPVHAGLHLWKETPAIGRVLHSVVPCDDGEPRIFEIGEPGLGIRELSAVKIRSEGTWPNHIPVIFRAKRPK